MKVWGKSQSSLSLGLRPLDTRMSVPGSSYQCHFVPTTALPYAALSLVRVSGRHSAYQRFLLVFWYLEVIEASLEDRGLIDIHDVDGDLGFVFACSAAQVSESDSGVRGLNVECVLLDEFIVQGLHGWQVWRLSLACFIFLTPPLYPTLF